MLEGADNWPEPLLGQTVRTVGISPGIPYPESSRCSCQLHGRDEFVVGRILIKIASCVLDVPFIRAIFIVNGKPEAFTGGQYFFYFIFLAKR